jgi:hypothetical protein
MTLALSNIVLIPYFIQLLQLKWLNQELVKIWPFVNEVLFQLHLSIPSYDAWYGVILLYFLNKLVMDIGSYLGQQVSSL